MGCVHVHRERGVWDLRCRDAQGKNLIIIQQDSNEGLYGSIYPTHPLMLDCFSSLEFVLDGTLYSSEKSNSDLEKLEKY